MIVVNATEIKNNFGKFLKYAAANKEVVIERNGKQIAKLVPAAPIIEENPASKAAGLDDTPISDSLLGILKSGAPTSLDYRKIKEEAVNAKYNSAHRAD